MFETVNGLSCGNQSKYLLPFCREVFHDGFNQSNIGIERSQDDNDHEELGTRVEAAFPNYKTECWETQLAAIFLFNADGCGFDLSVLAGLPCQE